MFYNEQKSTNKNKNGQIEYFVDSASTLGHESCLMIAVLGLTKSKQQTNLRPRTLTFTTYTPIATKFTHCPIVTCDKNRDKRGGVNDPIFGKQDKLKRILARSPLYYDWF